MLSVKSYDWGRIICSQHGDFLCWLDASTYFKNVPEIKIPLWVVTPKNTLDSLFQIAHEIFFVVNKKPMYKFKSLGKKEMQ